MNSSSSRAGVQDLAYIAVFTALIIVLGFVAIPIGTAGVPIVLQNAAIILAGLVLGPKRGLSVALLFLGIGLLNLPILAGGRTLFAALAGPTVGYLVGYVCAAFVAGLIAYRAPNSDRARSTLFITLGGFAGLLLQYFFGVVGLMLRANMDLTAAVVAQGPFILPDIAKVVFIIFIALAVHAAFPDLKRR
ncbi:biotin transporter BioY [Corynebacterium sp. ES2794-CONJ1]|uniref:biotin transporter BioY n=1 Tax=unclassified Corynebacterium TaxID=2624378 RepID=UPI002169111A|nr:MULTISPECIES: biotin transporter BioY [unclassified Corynebacterium]MCS4489153.1 biotin transporter BioY [Corynebacterium sp. ES2775-CONJ]MCS4490966.1 biotin transporter BioY [Corynebacterium sp. ES2715-CONJ3]MCS4531152.1 biotin transporter BioY [Corynebacterium sp. ES2730-CONJ]MCU9518520.1 biotin transporter BioY [Corynebacterium sp. ES2794-CONJ1]